MARPNDCCTHARNALFFLLPPPPISIVVILPLRSAFRDSPSVNLTVSQ